MDLSFTLTPRGTSRLPKWAVSLADIKAAAEIHRYGGGGIAVEGVLRGQVEEPDKVQLLACKIMSGGDGSIDAVSLGGSFNPLVARQLMVGEKG
ncbi:MAG: hypothetical protein AB7U35_06360 [Sphingobium sp.]